MNKSFILMAALPPTLGHIDLINFAQRLTDMTFVILVTRGDTEPYQKERLAALREHFALQPTVIIRELHLESETAEGNPYWAEKLKEFGFEKGDTLVASELWGEEIAVMLNGKFFPYDINREIRYTKATEIRESLLEHWEWIIPTFQKQLQKRVVLFGAESIGKTTLAKALHEKVKYSVNVFEYARPLLELNPKLDVEKMTDIWLGQKALQETAALMAPTPSAVFLDTDLYSTLGYWQFWDPETVPEGLERDANLLKADLYVLLESNIPFEEQAIRYGGKQRESTDDYWEELLKRYELPYVRIKAVTVNDRITELAPVLAKLIPNDFNYQRKDQ